MNDKNSRPIYCQRTTFDPDVDVVELGGYVPPIKCVGCGGRVDQFSRYGRPDYAHCMGCGSEWEVVG